RRLGRVILLGHIDPVIADGAGEDFALIEGVFGDFAFGDVVGAAGRRGDEDEKRSRNEKWRRKARHGRNPSSYGQSCFATAPGPEILAGGAQSGHAKAAMRLCVRSFDVLRHLGSGLLAGTVYRDSARDTPPDGLPK